MSIVTAVSHIHDMDIPAMPSTTRTSSLDSDSLSGSLSDSTPPTIDTAATSDDDEHDEHHKHHKKVRASSNPSNPNPNSNRNSYYDYTCSTSLLRTTLLSFARIGLSASTSSMRSSPTSNSSPFPSPSRSRCSSISATGPSSSSSPSLRSNSTTEICTNSNPSLAQFSPTPSASSSLAIYSSSRTHPPRSRSVHAGTSSLRLRTRPLPFKADDSTSAHSHNITPPFSFWRKRTAPHKPHPSPLVLPSISRAHVLDYLPDPALPIDKSNPPSRSASASPSSPCPSGFLKIDGSRDGLSFRTAENATQPNRPILIVGTPRPGYPIGLGADHDDNLDVFVVESPVGDDDNGLPNNENANQCKAKGKGKGKQPATIPAHLPVSSTSIPIPIPSQQQQPRVKIILPPPPVRPSTTLKHTKPTRTSTPPTLMSVEKSSRLMRDRVHCATCTTAGVDFPRCPRCAEAWCSRECRVARMVELPDGRRKHVCEP